MRHLFYALPFLALCVGGMSIEATDRMLAMLAVVRRSIDLRLGMKAAADLMGVSHSLLARQLHMRDGAHLSVARLGNLPDDELVHIAQGICDITGKARVITNERDDRLYHQNETLHRQLEDFFSRWPDTAEERKRA